MSCCKLQIHAVGGPSDLMCMYIDYQSGKGLQTRTVKIHAHNVCHLKQPCNSHIFKIYQKHVFLCRKTEK